MCREPSHSYSGHVVVNGMAYCRDCVEERPVTWLLKLCGFEIRTTDTDDREEYVILDGAVYWLDDLECESFGYVAGLLAIEMEVDGECKT